MKKTAFFAYLPCGDAELFTAVCLPEEGTTDWQALLGALRDVGYSGPWLYEIGLRPTKTMPRERALTLPII